jgi:AcrR family transcriptional regulator
MPRPAAPREDVRAAIVDAAERLLRTEGAQAVTTRAVAQAADVQAPTIYRLFGDKDGLVDAVAERVMATYVAGKASTAAEELGDPIADLRAAWRQHIEFGLANAELYALLNAPGRAARSPATSAGIDVLRARVHRIAAAGLLRVDEHRALDMIHAAGTGAVLTLLASPPGERDLDLPDAVFDAVTDAVVSREPATADTSVRAVTVTFATVLPELPGLSNTERALLADWLERALVELRGARRDGSQ